MLELRDIHFRYAHPVLSGVTLEVRAGEVVALLGANGAGKSTLLAVAAGLLRPSLGEALLDGREITSMSRREAARLLALVAQSGEVRFPLTALEYALAGRFAHVAAIGFDRPEDIEIVREALAATDALQFASRRFNELSSGERQRVVLSRALAQQPRVLLLDEPTANADLAHQVSLLELVRSLARDRNPGVLIVTHEINLAAEFADRVALLKGGRLIACGPTRDVMTAENLSECFETPLLVDLHPHSGNPRVSLIRRGIL
ncbi:MAG: ABC transporter ATP-binding protein [Acidobacteria bacterium]|nr:ABC transporter ATP-binding protein [Acidobacteriota bacterium]MCW5968298.1 ABC transporter ATP-binding protein [Blastocatellales bacterium]